MRPLYGSSSLISQHQLWTYSPCSSCSSRVSSLSAVFSAFKIPGEISSLGLHSRPAAKDDKSVEDAVTCGGQDAGIARATAQFLANSQSLVLVRSHSAQEDSCVVDLQYCRIEYTSIPRSRTVHFASDRVFESAGPFDVLRPPPFSSTPTSTRYSTLPAIVSSLLDPHSLQNLLSLQRPQPLRC